MADAQARPDSGLESAESLLVRFDTPADGWLGLELVTDNVKVVEKFSHIYPTLPDLCSALCDVLNGVTARTVVFFLEPDELELRFIAVDRSTIKLRISEFPDRHRSPEGTLRLDHTVTTRIVLTFWRALRRLQTALPEDDFERRFLAPFPSLQMASLTNSIALNRERANDPGGAG